MPLEHVCGIVASRLHHQPEDVSSMGRPFVVLRLPLPVAIGVVEQSLDTVAVPSPFQGTSPSWIRKLFGPLRDFFQSTSSPPERNNKSFSLYESAELADDLRGFYHNMGLRLTDTHRDVLHTWISKLDICSQSLDHGEFGVQQRINSQQLFRLVLLSRRLRDTGDLGTVVKSACDIILSGSMKEYVEKLLEADALKFPRKDELSRLRLSADVTWMLWKRVQNVSPRSAWARYLSWDSSPQYGRDYEMALVRSIKRADLKSLLDSVYLLHTLWSERPWESGADEFQRCKESELKLMSACGLKMEVHSLPAVLVGFGCSGFARKLQTLVHAMRLDHFTKQSILDYINEFITVTHDYGTEKQISRLKPTPFKAICPYFADTAHDLIDKCLSELCPEKRRQDQPDTREQDFEIFEEPSFIPSVDSDIFEAVESNGPQDHSMLDVSHLLETPPIHHINDTITLGLGDVMTHWDKAVYSSQQICKIVRKRSHRPRLLERCFTSRLAVHCQNLVTKFKGWIHTKRWATLVFSVPELKKIETAMRLFWDKRRFQGEDARQKEDTLKLANDVDEAVASSFYWAYLDILEEISCFERKATTFAEICPCHGLMIMKPSDDPNSVPEDVLKEMKPQWDKCPFRGMMVAELAEEFFQMLNTFANTSSARLLARLPPDINTEERATCLREFEAGRTHIIFGYVLKLSHLHNAPYAVFKMANLDTTVAWKAGDECMASWSDHPRIRRLQEPPLRDQYHHWRAGADLFLDDGLTELCEFIAELRFAYSTDRPAEAQHAKVHKAGALAPTHTEQYASFNLRSREMEQKITETPGIVLQLGWCLEQASNPRRCTQLLGLRGHPSLDQAYQAAFLLQPHDATIARYHRNTMHAKVIYHADTFSLYADTVPELEFGRLDGGAVVTHRAPIADEAAESGQQAANAHDGSSGLSDFVNGPDDDMIDGALAYIDGLDAGADVAGGAPQFTNHVVAVQGPSESQVSSLQALGSMLVPAIKAHIFSRWSGGSLTSSRQFFFCIFSHRIFSIVGLK